MARYVQECVRGCFVCVVTALQLCDMYCDGNRCRCGCGDDAGVSVCRMGAAAELWLHALAVTGAAIWRRTCIWCD
jgi:hypothetical protein